MNWHYVHRCPMAGCLLDEHMDTILIDGYYHLANSLRRTQELSKEFVFLGRGSTVCRRVVDHLDFGDVYMQSVGQ